MRTGVSHATALNVAVIGGGVIGLGIAWRLGQRGARVAVFEKETSGKGASHAAAGMLAACAEAEPGEGELVALGRASQKQWPAFAMELEEAAGVPIDLRCEGILDVALTADDAARLHHHHEYQRSLNLPVEWLSAAEVRRLEPHLGSRVAGALFNPEDHQVDNRKLAEALRIAACAAGATIRESAPVKDILIDKGRASGVLLADGNRIEADAVVVAAGAWSRQIGGLAPELRPPVRPVKGQVVALQMDPSAPLLRHVLWVPGAYLVPRNEGRLIIGATVEEKGFDASLTAGGVLSLLEAAWRAIPAIEELPIAEMWVGHRPGSRDDAPIIGRASVPGVFYACGHGRNGILLTPITAEAIAGSVLGSAIDPVVSAFGIERFAPTSLAAE